MTAIARAAFLAGQYVRATKLTGKVGATLHIGDVWEGTLQCDVELGSPICIDDPGTHFLFTTPISSIAPEGDTILASSSNSTYRVEVVQSWVDQANAEMTARKAS